MATPKVKTTEAKRSITKIPRWLAVGESEIFARATADAKERADLVTQWVKDGLLTIRLVDNPMGDPRIDVLAGGDNPERVTITLLCDMGTEGAISQAERILLAHERALSKKG